MNKATIGYDAAPGGRQWATSSACSRPSSATATDAIVSFKPLDEQIILRVVDKFRTAAGQQLAEKKIGSDLYRRAAAQAQPKKGFDPLAGARPMQRLIRTRSARRWPASCCSCVLRKAGA